MSELHKSRFRIGGKPYAASEYPAALEKAILSQIERGDYSPESIGGKLGKHRSVISKKIQDMAAEGKIKLTETGRVQKLDSMVEKKAYEEMDSTEFVEKNESVREWVDDMKHRGRGGSPLATTLVNLATFKTVCDILKVNPSAFTVSSDVNEELLTNLRDILRVTKPNLRAAGWSKYTRAIRNFAMSHNVNWARNAAPTIASGKKANYGAYSNIYATDLQREGIMAHAMNFTPDVRMAILIGHEVLTPRDDALRSLKVNQIHFRQRAGFEVAEFEVYESKTDTTWPKQAFDPRVIRALKAHIATKTADSHLFGNGEPISQVDLALALKQCYASVGIDVISDGNEKMINYWKDKPIHVMRHTTGTMWMRRSGMNPLLVAKQGWKTTDMVTQVYANMGLEEAWNAGRCDFCKPDPLSNGDAHYDSWKCAIAGLNARFGA